MPNFSLKYIFKYLKVRTLSFTLLLLFCGDIQSQNNTCKYSTQIQLVNTFDSFLIQGIEVFHEKSHKIKYTNELGEVTFENLCDSINEFDVVLPDTHFHIKINATLIHRNKVMIHSNFGGDFYKIPTINIQNRNSDIICIIPPLPNLRLEFNSPFKINDFSLSLGNLLKKLPMIQTTQSGATISKPLIQGMSGIRAPLFWNGIRIEGQNWGGDHAPEIALFGDETIELSKGSYALKYGADLWGNMVNFKHQFTKAHHQIDYYQQSEYQSNGNGLKTAGIINVGHDPLSRIKSSYIKFSGQILGNYKVPDGILKNTAMNEFSMAGGHSTKKSEIHYSIYQSETGIYTGSHIGNLTDLNTAIHATKPMYLAESMNYQLDLPKQVARQISTIFSNHISPQFWLQLSYQNNLRQEFAYTRTGRSDIPQININVNSITAKATYLFVNPKIEVGTDQQFIHQQYGANYLVPDYDGIKSGFYLSKNWQHYTYNTQWKQEIIARFDVVKRSGFERNEMPFQQSNQGFSGGYSMLYSTKNIHNVSHNWQVHLSQIWRQPAPNELYSYGIHHGSASFEEGNPNLKPETGQKFDLNYHFSNSKLWNKFDLSIAGFFQTSQNFILLTPQKDPILTVKGAFPVFKYTQAATIYSGFEYFLRYTKLSKSFSKTIQIENKMNITIGKYVNGAYPTGIPAATFNLNIESEIYKNLFLSINALHQFKQIWYSVSDFLPPPDAATIFKTELKTVLKSKWELGLFIDNLTNLKYRNYTDRFRYFMDMPGRNIGLKIAYQIHHHKNHKD